ncbi:hypothetical protein LTR12_010999 [Friedmanniomyces endolithicus]|nr:hypothetical protein LTR12_010999 [Friedmanniomyces endolithicus]
MPPSINEPELDRFAAEFHLRFHSTAQKLRVGRCRLHKICDLTTEAATDRPADAWATTDIDAPFLLTCDRSEIHHRFKDIKIDFQHLNHDGERAQRTTLAVLRGAVFEMSRGQQQAPTTSPAAVDQPAADPSLTAHPIPNGHSSAATVDADRAMCQICLETYEATPQQAVRWTPCAHKFHESCLGTWFECKENCPYCRQSFVGFE